MTMRYKLLGRSGLRVSELSLGTMTFGNTSWGTSEDDATEMYRRYRALGGNFLDTANEMQLNIARLSTGRLSCCDFGAIRGCPTLAHVRLGSPPDTKPRRMQRNPTWLVEVSIG